MGKNWKMGMELSSDFEILDMELDVMVKKKYAHVYLINKEELKLASSGLHDSENEPSEDEKDATEFDVQVEREPFRIDTNVGVHVEKDCGDSEELKSIYSSDEEGDIERQRFPQFYAERDTEDPHFEKGQEFIDFSTFKRAVKNYSIKSKHQIRFKR
ncbi:hypothetical protein LINPERHAP1_LOCUS21739, partial [Linum perenne]